MPATHITARVKLVSNLPIKRVGEILGLKVFSGLQFGGKELNIYDEVPAIFIKSSLLGCSVILQDNSGFGDEHTYILEGVPIHQVPASPAVSVKLDVYLSSLIKEALKDTTGIMIA